VTATDWYWNGGTWVATNGAPTGVFMFVAPTTTDLPIALGARVSVGLAMSGPVKAGWSWSCDIGDGSAPTTGTFATDQPSASMTWFHDFTVAGTFEPTATITDAGGTVVVTTTFANPKPPNEPDRPDNIVVQ